MFFFFVNSSLGLAVSEFVQTWSKDVFAIRPGSPLIWLLIRDVSTKHVRCLHIFFCCRFTPGLLILKSNCFSSCGLMFCVDRTCGLRVLKANSQRNQTSCCCYAIRTRAGTPVCLHSEETSGSILSALRAHSLRLTHPNPFQTFFARKFVNVKMHF